jgi:hypothetical protein
MNSLFENKGTGGFTRTTKPCGHNDLSTVTLGGKYTHLRNGKEFTTCNTCGQWHRRWWWNGKPNGWVGLA